MDKPKNQQESERAEARRSKVLGWARDGDCQLAAARSKPADKRVAMFHLAESGEVGLAAEDRESVYVSSMGIREKDFHAQVKKYLRRTAELWADAADPAATVERIVSEELPGLVRERLSKKLLVDVTREVVEELVRRQVSEEVAARYEVSVAVTLREKNPGSEAPG